MIGNIYCDCKQQFNNRLRTIRKQLLEYWKHQRRVPGCISGNIGQQLPRRHHGFFWFGCSSKGQSYLTDHADIYKLRCRFKRFKNIVDPTSKLSIARHQRKRFGTGGDFLGHIVRHLLRKYRNPYPEQLNQYFSVSGHESVFRGRKLSAGHLQRRNIILQFVLRQLSAHHFMHDHGDISSGNRVVFQPTYMEAMYGLVLQ